ncbi:Hypothetical predicted protein [Mytilus galloprovincialis]|uniref:WSC domain-containing protein n=1 Tax=Mytilus galloprovincialis TaxID=29158 RepID=A0A8B6FUQ8_MYTGA|nr:Hypothetical predicted protein [Mytilus galloprovincialis]
MELQASNECFCDNSLGNANVFQRKSDNECDLPCKGNQSQMCGGFLASSVYELIPVTVPTTKETTPGHSTVKTTDMTTPGHSTRTTTQIPTPRQSTVKTIKMTIPTQPTVTTRDMTIPGHSTVKTIKMTIPTQSSVTTRDMTTLEHSSVKTIEMTIPRYSTVTTTDIITLGKSEVTTTDMKILERSPGTSLQVTEPRTLEVTTIKTTPIFGKIEVTSVYPIIPLVTSVQPIIPSECLCPCSKIGKNKYDFLRGMNLPRDQLREILKQELDLIKKELSVNKSNTTRKRRSKISAPDDRVSATSVGYVGVVFICFIGVLFVFFDILGCFVVKF